MQTGFSKKFYKVLSITYYRFLADQGSIFNSASTMLIDDQWAEHLRVKVHFIDLLFWFVPWLIWVLGKMED